jgi:PadR family transcriptional regulator PadR
VTQYESSQGGVRINSQYKKGVLDLCVLSLLHRGDRYGYDVSEALSRRIEIADGTVYPILRKLKNEGLVTAYLSEDSGGPPRKYYSLTSTGRAEYRRRRAEWLAFARAVDDMIRVDDEQGGVSR